MSYIYGALCKARKTSCIYIYLCVCVCVDLRLPTLKAVSFYLLHNVSILNIENSRDLRFSQRCFAGSSPMECDAVWLGEQFPTFRRMLVPTC
jgi:hypothetical protein